MSGFVLSGYELVLVAWGVCWMLLGAGMMYLIHRVMAADERQVESEHVAPVAMADDQVHHPPHGIAA